MSEITLNSRTSLVLKPVHIENADKASASKNAHPRYDSVEISGPPKKEDLPFNLALGLGPRWSLKIDKAFINYYEGNGSEEEVENVIRAALSDIRNEFIQQGYTDKDLFPKLIEDVYGYMRITCVSTAFTACYTEGEKLVDAYLPKDFEATHSKSDFDEWMYYDSKYYYKCEDMIDHVKSFCESLAKEHGVEEIDLPRDYGEGDLRADNYASFNSAVNNWNRNCAMCGNMFDESAAPPRGYKLLYIGNSTGVYNIPGDITRPDGSPADLYDGMVQVSYESWSFSSRVPLPYNLADGPMSQNLLDMIQQSVGNDYPKVLESFLGNQEFFIPFYASNYTSTHRRQL